MKLDIVDRLPEILRDNAIIQNVAKGQRLFRRGDRANYLYLIEQGRFQEVSYPEKMAVLQILNRGETLGETSLLFTTYHSTAIAQTEARVIAYPKSMVLESLEQSPLIVEATVEMLSKKIDEFQKRLEWRNISVADRRVLKYFEDNWQKQSEDTEDDSRTLTLNAPLQEIAAELGFVPGTLSRALAKLEADCKIARQSDRITLHNSDAA
ncbi:MAG: Crp/Fnr family transcriptional regulator [Pleurocapsa sp. MO_226.B13]|nr:Crp/Fnr family transcriptional regulator [Pleurocapsa sp. MO_226.B13]